MNRMLVPYEQAKKKDISRFVSEPEEQNTENFFNGYKARVEQLLLLAQDAGKDLAELESPQHSESEADSNAEGAQVVQADSRTQRTSGLTPKRIESGGVTGSVRESVHNQRKAMTGDSTSARDSQRPMY